MKKTLFKVENRVIDTIDKTNFTGLLNVDKLEFIFNEEWDDLDKTLVIILGETTLNLAMINDSVVLPPDIYDAEECQIGIFGTKVENGEAKKILTTMPYILPICEGMYKEGEEPSNLPTPTQWDLYITEINRLIEDFNENVIDKTAEFDEHVAEEFDELKGNFYTKNQTDTLLGGKQDTLVAGSNITIDPETNTISSHDTTYGNATSETAGLMSASDKTKMDTIASGAQVNVIEKVSVNGTEKTVTNKGVDISVPTNNNQLANGAGYITKEVDNLTNYMKTGDINTALGLKLDASQKGANGGVAELDNTGKVPSSQLPSYVDDVLEYASTSAFPATGETGKIYVALDTNKTYRWGGSAYTEISESLALGETSSTAFRGDHGKTAYDHATDPNKIASAQTKGFYKVGVTAEGHIKEVQAVAKADLTGLGVEDASNKVQTISDQSTHAQYPDAKCVYDNFKDRDNTIENISARVNVLEKKVNVYGVKRARNNNSSSKWERTDDSIGLVANAQKGTTPVKNDFDNIAPWCNIKRKNINMTTDTVTAYIGEAGFALDGTNGDVYDEFPDIYYKVWQDTDWDYVQIADGYVDGFTKVDSFDLSAYDIGYEDNKVRSYSGMLSGRGTSIVNQRSRVTALGSNYALMDWRYYVVLLLYLVEYADYNSQSVLGAGLTGMRSNKNDKALVDETNTNRIVVTNSVASNFIIGQTIAIGTSNVDNFSVASERRITGINDYDDGTVTGKEIVFDGSAVNIAVGNVIWSCQQYSGGGDFLGMKSGCLVDDGKHCVNYRGLENVFGNQTDFIDGVNIQNGQVYVCYDPAEYVSDKFTSPYVALGYVNAYSGNDNYNGYQKTLGFDSNHPLMRFATEIANGASSSTYMCDNYYISTGNKVARVGGNVSNGASAGLWFCGLYITSSYSYWTFGARALRYQT